MINERFTKYKIVPETLPCYYCGQISAFVYCYKGNQSVAFPVEISEGRMIPLNIGNNKYYYVSCLNTECEARGGKNTSQQEAIESWTKIAKRMKKRR